MQLYLKRKRLVFLHLMCKKCSSSCTHCQEGLFSGYFVGFTWVIMLVLPWILTEYSHWNACCIHCFCWNSYPTFYFKDLKAIVHFSVHPDIEIIIVIFLSMPVLKLFYNCCHLDEMCQRMGGIFCYSYLSFVHCHLITSINDSLVKYLIFPVGCCSCGCLAFVHERTNFKVWEWRWHAKTEQSDNGSVGFLNEWSHLKLQFRLKKANSLRSNIVNTSTNFNACNQICVIYNAAISMIWNYGFQITCSLWTFHIGWCELWVWMLDECQMAIDL